MSGAMTFTCPKCRREYRREDSPAFPFCSKRCQTLDFGGWMSGQYAVPGPPALVDPETGEVIDPDDEDGGSSVH